MTAIAMACAVNGIVVASDGISYRPGGITVAYESKVILAPEWSCVLAHRGAGGILRLVRYLLTDQPISDLDGVLRFLPQASRVAFDEYRSRGFEREPHFSIFVGGWSQERARFELHVLRSREKAVPSVATGELVSAPPFETLDVGGMVLAPVPDKAAAERCGLDLDAVMKNTSGLELDELTIRAVCAARFTRDQGEGTTDDAVYGVGGFVQLTTLTMGSVDSRIVHRWPDPLGEVIDPSRGDPTPSFARVPVE